jgi:hypothetical protein
MGTGGMTSEEPSRSPFGRRRHAGPGSSGLSAGWDPADRSLEGLRGRGLFLRAILPILIMGSLIGSFLGTIALGSDGVARVGGYALALATGFVAAAVALVLICWIFPPTRLSWPQIGRATLIVAIGISLLSFLFILFVGVGANFEQHLRRAGWRDWCCWRCGSSCRMPSCWRPYRIALKA